MKLTFAALPIALVLTATLLPAMPAAAEINLPAEKIRIYETPGDGLSFPGWPAIPSLPGHTVDEAREAAGGSAGGDKGGDSSGGGDKSSSPKKKYVNPRLGLRDSPRDVQLQVFSRGKDGDSFDTITLTSTKDFSYIAKVEPLTTYNPDGTSTQTGVTLEFRVDVMSSQAEIAKAIFGRSGSTFTSCDALDMTFICTLKTPRRIAASPTPFVADLVGDVSDRQIPLCSGIVADGGYGVQTVVTPADVSCESAPDKEPVRLEIETILGGLQSDFPVVRGGDGSIVYSAPQSAAGTYIGLRVWAVAADGTTSWPFYVAIRNRFAPTAVEGASVDAIRGVDTVIHRASLFTDEDVDTYGALSGDHLTSTVVNQGSMGGAWFDAAGDLHYQSIDVIRGSVTDHVSVQTTDSFGLPSAVVDIPVHISDITPGCSTGGATTDASTPVRVSLSCWITPAAGWRQLDGLRYALVEAPTFGSLGAVDPVSGTATYTPDPTHTGPVSFTFSAENNGAVRTSTFTVNVLGSP